MQKKLYQLFKSCSYKLSTDSRKIIPGGIFLALKGERFNGNQFALKALEQGAAYAVVDEAIGEDERLIKVDSGLDALQDIALAHRRAMKAQVLAIAGSNGKTTTKELVHAVLSQRFRTQATTGNLNNHIGVPLTLLTLREDTELLVVELGANHPGEVEQLCKIAEPDYGLLTSIGKEHLEGFGSMKAIVETECALYHYIEERDGTNFVFTDDPYLREEAKSLKTAFNYGSSQENDIVGQLEPGELAVALRWETSYMSIEDAPLVRTALWGNHNFGNILGACAVGRYFGVQYDRINEAIAAYRPSNNRSQIELRDGNTLIIDCYNANPGSMEPAIKQFASENSCRHRVAILGDMLELGEHSPVEHQNIVDIAEALMIDKVCLVGEEFRKTEIPHNRFLHFQDVGELIKHFPLGEISDSCILIKGSRGIKLEKWIELN